MTENIMFIDRENELGSLENEYRKNSSSFTIVYGRRRVGKTTLISEYIRNKPSIFWKERSRSRRTIRKRANWAGIASKTSSSVSGSTIRNDPARYIGFVPKRIFSKSGFADGLEKADVRFFTCA
jgi:AAA+ ATPase superfamily predicted ATPase